MMNVISIAGWAINSSAQKQLPWMGSHTSQKCCRSANLLQNCKNTRNGQKAKTYNRRDSQMVTHSSTSLPVQCLCTAERTGCPVFTDLWSYVFGCVFPATMKYDNCETQSRLSECGKASPSPQPSLMADKIS